MRKMIDGSKILVIFITAILFSLSYFYSISTVIIHTLSFLILMEVTRTIYDYAMKEVHRVKVRYIIDGGILFAVRELFVGMVMMKTALELSLVIIAVSLMVMGVLIFFRYKVVMSSPDRLENCSETNIEKGKGN